MIQNGIVINSFTTLCLSQLVSLTVDSNGYMAVSCQIPNTLYLYHVNGSYMNKYISVAYLLIYTNYDAQNLMAIGATSKIIVYN